MYKKQEDVVEDETDIGSELQRRKNLNQIRMMGASDNMDVDNEMHQIPRDNLKEQKPEPYFVDPSQFQYHLEEEQVLEIYSPKPTPRLGTPTDITERQTPSSMINPLTPEILDSLNGSPDMSLKMYSSTGNVGPHR